MSPHAHDARQPAPPIAVRVLGADLRSARDVVVPLAGPGASYRLKLVSLAGARTTQVPVLENGAVAFRVEIPCHGEEKLALDLRWDAQHGLLADAPGRRVLRLPADARYAPPSPLHPLAGGMLDLCFVIDGTARDAQLEPLLAPSTARDDFIARLLAFGDALRGAFDDVRLCVLAFGDHQPDEVEAEDLKPKYVLYPAWRSARDFLPWTQDQLATALKSIPPTPGGDFVDALGDALAACLELEWRHDARRVVVVSGDSPGFSLTHPAPAYADAHVRAHDVDAAAAALHQIGVEIMTIYHRPPNIGAYDKDDASPFVQFAHNQYVGLASYPALHVELSDFDPARAVKVLGVPPPAVGRNTALGLGVDF